MNRVFIGFVIASAIAAGVNFLSRILLNYIFSYEVSIIIAFFFGMITAFSLNKIFVFKPIESKTVNRFIYFTLINIFALIITLLISILFSRYIFPAINWRYYPATTAHMLGIVAPIFTSFYLHKKFTFKG